jgi:hypothetical protein
MPTMYVLWDFTNLQFGCEGCVCVLLLDGSKNEVCIMIYALSPSVNDEFAAKYDNFISRSRKIFLMVEYCCQLYGASANWITDFSGARLMRSERWHGIGFQIRAFFRPLMTQW